MEIRTNKLWHETQRNWTNENANYNVNYKTYFLSSHAIFRIQSKKLQLVIYSVIHF